VPVCRELGIGIVAYSPLGRGMLTGAFSKPEDIPEGRHHPNRCEHLHGHFFSFQ
jgi:aryl-alcohol dehydrogenase-like predicted oxidoreductase